MAFSSKVPLVLISLSSLFLHAAIAELVCEDLPNSICAFSIASSSKRCLLETSVAADHRSVEYQCKTSEVVVEGMTEYIETDQCVLECGVDRETVGISSDALFEPQFITKLCSPPCYQECPNIVDLYFNLAAGEGVYLPYVCEKELTNPHRVMVEFMSFSNVADPDPDVSGSPSPAPAPAPAPAPVTSTSTSTSPAPAPL